MFPKITLNDIMTMIFELAWHMKWRVHDDDDWGETSWLYSSMAERIKQENQNQQDQVNKMNN